MKTIFSFLLCCLSLTSISAQILESGQLNTNPANYLKGFGSSPQLKSTACGLDTVQYPLGKAVGLNAINVNAGSAVAVGQYYDAPQAITISGVDFYAYSEVLPSINVLAQLYVAGPDSLPTGAPLANVSVAVDSSFSGGDLDTLRKTAIFTTPVTVSVPYVVVISNNSANVMGLVCSDYAAGDGQQEWLGKVLIGGVWLSGQLVNVGTSVFDADWLLHPIVSYDLSAGFNTNPSCITGPSTSVSFTNNSSGVMSNRMYNVATFLDLQRFSHTWDFGNNTGVANAVDTTFSYTGPAEYTVGLTDTLFGWTTNCSHDTSITLGTPPVSDFSNTTSSLSVSLFDSSEYATTRLWDFGDGNTSGDANPIHSYNTPGTYTVCLEVSNSCGTDNFCQSVTVSCTAPVADFSFVSNAYDVDFTDLSSGVIAGSSWSWDFGDGTTSMMQNPSVTYANTGSYNVCLTVQSICGDSTICQNVTVVCDTPDVDFSVSISGLVVDFTDESIVTGTASYEWDFGDGNTSTLQNPSHTYASTSEYLVCLSVTDACGSREFCQAVDLDCNTPVVSFTSDPTNSPTYNFVSTSTNTGTATYAWDFGDGATASTASASHTFATSQLSYTVCLTVTNICGQDSACSAIDVTTGIQGFQAIGVRMFPNPTSGLVAIEFEQGLNDYTFSVLNTLGQVVFEQNVSSTATSFDLSTLNKGIYFVQISNEEGRYLESLILK